MSNFSRVNFVGIGDGANTNGVTTLPGIKKGDLFLLKEDMSIVTTASAAASIPAAGKVFVAQGTGDGTFRLSAPIQGSAVTKYESAAYAAPTLKTVYLGYNGTTGNINIADETEYTLNVLMLDDKRIYDQKQTRELFNVVTGVSATRSELAYDILKLFYTRVQNGTNKSLNDGRFVDLCVVADSADVDIAQTATVVKGSKYVTYGGAHGLAVGDVVRFGTATTDATYLVSSVISSTVVKLDSPYNGTSTTLSSGSTGKVTVTGSTKFGFKLVSQTVKWNGIDTFEYTDFDAVFVESNPLDTQTPVIKTVATPAFGGVGTPRQVYDYEFFAQGYSGVTSRTEWYDSKINPQSAVDFNATYSVINIEADTINRGDFMHLKQNPIAIHLFAPTGTAQFTNSGDNFLDILNGYFNGVLGFTEIASL
jgi:hypothetical protein